MKRIHKLLAKWKRLAGWRAGAQSPLWAHFRTYTRVFASGMVHALWGRWIG